MFKIITQVVDKKKVLKISMLTIDREEYYLWYRRLERFFMKYLS